MFGAREVVIVRGLASMACLACGATACHGRVTQDDCTHMLDKYLDMVIAADPSTKNLPAEQASAVREMKRAVKKADRSYREVEAECETQVSRAEYDCAMKANIPDDWEACIE